ncbi:hypothetical protein [Rhodococcus sp. NPDC127528]|uniref:rhamnosyltransferase WsaF family glycosyltransferase n=1 Tax=unclassified Rhodococcus (in: high G+C Gram-positive bacteria) TaxID=192944 RepID=UPI00363A22BF
MVEALESAGHKCVLHVYDRYSSPVTFHENAIRNGWPTIRASVVDAKDGLQPCDCYLATSWDTAHVLGSHGAMPGRRLYFIQDFEPFFYARGSEYALAEDTYRFGFRNIALGHMVAELVRKHAPVDVVEFSCDSTIYALRNDGERAGIVFYSRPQTPRRGSLLAQLALSEFHRNHPDQTINVFGDTSGDFPFPVTRHGQLSPHQLALLYNQVIGGIGLSFTNISLTVEEMLACGVVPVVNDSPYSRADMPSPMVKWAQPTPSGIADALTLVLGEHAVESRAVAAAHSARGDNWRATRNQVVRIVEDEVYEGATTSQ